MFLKCINAAAIDEIVLRLLNIKASLQPKRFNMIYIGHSKSMHQKIQTYSLTN